MLHLSEDLTIGVPVVLAGGSGPERFRRIGELAHLADQAGISRVWTNELYTHSATVAMAVAAQTTARCGIGSAIAYGVGRSPMVLAAEARDLDALSGGRLVLGLGNGTRRMMEDWHGADGTAPAERMEELVDVLRALWRLHEGPVTHDGRFYRVKITPTVAIEPPVSPRLPIYTAGVNPRMLEVAGRVADGVLAHPMFTVRYAAEMMRPAVARGAKLRGRIASEIESVAMVMTSLHDDVEVARREVAGGIAAYAGSRAYDRIFELHGWQADVAAVRDAMRRGDAEGMAAAVSDDMIDTIGIACRRDELGSALRRYSGIFDHLVLLPPPWGLAPQRAEDVVRQVIELFGQAAAPVLA